MKYFIGVTVPKNFKNKIELLRAEFRFFTTEPHITLVPPPALPEDDSFIEDLVKTCKETKAFNIKLHNLDQFGERVLYVKVYSPELISLREKLYDNLKLIKEKRPFTPHLTVVKQRPRRKVNIEKIRRRAEIKLNPYPKYPLNSLVVYYQPKEKSIYLPYMVIPFE
ncbi:MAG: hypothetical protein GX339_09600 [Tissierellia bacterium]|nr:hypothetical protein [Tissierellia bacterium]